MGEGEWRGRWMLGERKEGGFLRVLGEIDVYSNLEEGM